MLRRTLLSCAVVCLALTASCGPSLRHIQTRSVAEAELLKAEVAAANLQDENIAIADNYLEMAKAGSSEEAMYRADLAAALYREALARRSLAASQTALAGSEAALRKSMEQVQKYEKIMKEISTSAKAAAPAPAAVNEGGQ